RTQETVILEDASSQNPFSVDPYVVQRRARSILCLPLTNQGKLIGILYLENNLAPRVFTPDRVTVLKVLASQAAIALENTRLYRDFADRERKLLRLVDSNIIGTFLWKIAGPSVDDVAGDVLIVEANDAFLRIVGYQREDLIAGRLTKSVLSLPEWRERDALTLAEVKAVGTVPPFEKEYLRKDGTRVPVLIGFAAFDERRLDGFAFVIDLTERKKAEGQLLRSEAWLTQAQSLSRTGNWVYDATALRYLYWSEESYRMWGFDPQQGLPSRENMWQRIHPDDRDRVWQVVQEAVDQKKDFTAEFRILLPDETIKHLVGTSHHLFSPLGTLVEVVTTTVDVSERKRAEEEHERLRQLESDLAHL